MNDRLFRSRRNRIVGGVAAGFAEYLNLEPIIIRLLFVVITIFNGLGILLYIVLWIVVPEEIVVQTGTGTTTAQGDKDFDKHSAKENDESSRSENIGDNEYTPADKDEKKSSGKGRIIIGLTLLVLGFLFLFDNFFPYFEIIDIFPLLLLGLGIFLIWNSISKQR